MSLTSERKQKLRVKLFTKQGGVCCYCEKPVWLAQGVDDPQKHFRKRRRQGTIEHLRRLCEGGTHARDNLALACHACNQARGSRDWLTFKSLRLGEGLVV